MRILPVSLRSVLVELADLDETLALFASLEARPLAAIEEIVPAARTLLVRFRPGAPPDLGAFAADLRARDLSARAAPSERLVEIPTLYDGEDLAEVARLTGLAPDEVVARHTACEFTVAFTGFAPGFGYLVDGDPALHVARRQSPRTRIPAGTVALAGHFAGVYPQEGPGGWQLIGTTPLRMFDLSREPAALFQPGTRVRFTPLADRGAFDAIAAREAARGAPTAPAAPHGGTSLRVSDAPMPPLFQDDGRPGQAAQGVSAAGALDRSALHAGNRLVGNPPGTPALEIVGGGFRFKADGAAVVALAGTDAALEIRDAAGRRRVAPAGRPVSLEPGDRVALVAPSRGLRTYLAARGGFAVEPVLGSASVDSLARLGPPPVAAGDRLAIRPRVGGPAVGDPEPAPARLPAAGETVVLDIVMGPRTEWFTPRGVETLTAQEWTVTPLSNRVGLRIRGERPLERRDPAAELPSEGTANGAIQVPHDGQPVLFMADHPLTGGYPVIATLAEHHLDLAAQLPVGARIRFHVIRPFAEIEPERP
ncbi:carboxyltransferase domain-containing protein [Aureimonas flava]|uniref:Carboxyltransferase domain-containing protein n=1 Tax=Aureimonas flava TaxID=2320271 RepID=A0A3A1WH07_9HYPH|nr:carboxyltransferase domain-containing protein [Aureimonas flava]RIX97965.1 carboxyltransferase domain-containing protein [Aureimonas flava]